MVRIKVYGMRVGDRLHALASYANTCSMCGFEFIQIIIIHVLIEIIYNNYKKDAE